MQKFVIERRVTSRPEQDKPRDHSLEEVIEKLDGLNIGLKEVLQTQGAKFNPYSQKCVVKDFMISLPYSQDGETKVRVIGKFFKGYGDQIIIDYVHTFN